MNIWQTFGINFSFITVLCCCCCCCWFGGWWLMSRRLYDIVQNVQYVYCEFAHIYTLKCWHQSPKTHSCCYQNVTVCSFYIDFSASILIRFALFIHYYSISIQTLFVVNRSFLCAVTLDLVTWEFQLRSREPTLKWKRRTNKKE